VQVEHPILFIYRNRKSVIIGRNQNPWQEANVAELAREGIVLVRRRSGGGTVYHDEGNTNYSVMLPRAQFERGENARLVAEAVQEMGVQGVTVTDRYDVCVGDRKVSGSAFRITSRRAYHHGTMLLSSDLAQLKGALRPTPHINIVDSKAVVSVRSPVACLAPSSTTSTTTTHHLRFVHHLCRAFSRHYYGSFDAAPRPQMIGESELETNEFVRAGYAELKSWDWIYGQTPQFTREVLVPEESGADDALVPVQVTYRHARIAHSSVLPAQISPALQRAVSRLFPLGTPLAL